MRVANKTKSTSRKGRKGGKQRKGVVAALTAFVLVAVFGFVAFAIDTGRIVVERSHMQNATDAVAFAATQELATYWDRQMPWASDSTANETVSNARSIAAQVATANGVYIDPNADLQFGNRTLDSNGNWSTTWGVGPYNTVRVTTRRDQSDTSAPDGRFRLSFGWAIGIASVELTTTATAAFSDGIDGFSSPDENTSPLLPFAMSATSWQDMLNGNGDDEWSYDANTGNVTQSGDGIPELRLFGDDGNGNGGGGNGNGNGNGGGGNGSGNNQVAPGNFGILDIGAPNNGNPDLWRQISDGPSAEDFAYHGGELALDANGSTTLSGTPGMKASMAHALADIVGQPRVVPLYEPAVSGQGANAQYNIVGFVGVRVVEYNLQGGDKYILVQPCPITSPTSIPGSSGTSYGVRNTIQLID